MTPLHRTYRLLSALLVLSLVAGSLPLAWQARCADAEGRPMRCCCGNRTGAQHPPADQADDAGDHSHDSRAETAFAGGCRMQAPPVVDRQAAPAPERGFDGPVLFASSGPPRPAPAPPAALDEHDDHLSEPGRFPFRDRTVLYAVFLI